MGVPSKTPAPVAEDKYKYKYLIAIAVTLAAVLELIDTSIVNVAIPHMMGNLGATLDEIGTVLRHKSPDTTAHYAKVDIAALQQIAQPWPKEIRPC